MNKFILLRKYYFKSLQVIYFDTFSNYKKYQNQSDKFKDIQV